MGKEPTNSTLFPNLSIEDAHKHNWSFGDIYSEDHKYDEKQIYKPLQYKNMDLRSDKNSDIWFYTCDGRKVSTMEDVIQYNDHFYKKMMNDNSEEKGMNK